MSKIELGDTVVLSTRILTGLQGKPLKVTQEYLNNWYEVKAGSQADTYIIHGSDLDVIQKRVPGAEQFKAGDIVWTPDGYGEVLYDHTDADDYVRVSDGYRVADFLWTDLKKD